MSETEVAKREETAMETTRMSEATYMPDVDIKEDNDSITLTANMPGANRDSVDVTVENNVLTIEAAATVDVPQGYKLVGQEYGVGKYRRDFRLSGNVSPEGIKARMRSGVLHLRIPKREEVKLHKVQIES